MLGGKRNEGCKDKKRGEDLNKTAIIVLSVEQVREKQNLETPEMAKKPVYSAHLATFSSSQICVEVQKPY